EPGRPVRRGIPRHGVGIAAKMRRAISGNGVRRMYTVCRQAVKGHSDAVDWHTPNMKWRDSGQRRCSVSGKARIGKEKQKTSVTPGEDDRNGRTLRPQKTLRNTEVIPDW